MDQFLPYAVSVFDDGRHRSVGEYRRFRAAVMVAKLSLQRPKITLAVVRDVNGALVFAVDSDKTWTAESSDIAEGSPYSEFRPVGAPRGPLTNG